MERLKPTFSDVVYSEMGTWLGRQPSKGCNSTVVFYVWSDFAVACIECGDRTISVCCELDWPDHRHESLGVDGRSTHPGRLEA